LQRGIEFLHERIDDHPWSALVSQPIPLSEIASAFEEARKQRWPRVALRP
jgi:hypothetical protein